jgi:RecA-family ATPase
VFPCDAEKKPLTKHGFQDATTDPERIRRWWTQHPDSLIGVPTGAASRLVVIDVDCKNGHDGEESLMQLKRELGPLPETVEVLTPSGGRHLYFGSPPGAAIRSSAGKLADGIDIRANGGYVIVPPSRVNGRGYEWEGSNPPEPAALPAAWVSALTAREGSSPPDEEPGGDAGVGIREGQRNAVLASLGGSMRRRGASREALEAALLAENATRCNPPLAEAEVRRIAASVSRYQPEPETQPNPPDVFSLNITEAELAAARLTPDCIVSQYLYADVAQLAGPGAAGKTTLVLYEALRIVLGRPVFGLPVRRPGWVLIVTAEDARPRLVARLRELMAHEPMTPEARALVLRSIRIWDVSGQALRLITMAQGSVVLTTLADQMAAAYKADPPVMALFDPVVSFGASELAVNDNEQGLITAARRIVRELGCCVRFLHHTGKAHAREKIVDQYAGRGGSALADGSRMTCVLQPWVPGDSGNPPPGFDPDPDAGMARLVRAKLSYAPPNLPTIWVKRTGFRYEFAIESPALGPDEARETRAQQLLEFVKTELAAKRLHSRNTLDAEVKSAGFRTRAELRQALAFLESGGRIIEDLLPEAQRKGGRQHYLRPANLAGEDSR